MTVPFSQDRRDDQKPVRQRQKIAADDLTFYSPLVEVVARPPHPLPRATAYLLLTFLCIAVTWCFIGTVSINAVASGRIVVADGNINIQPFGPAVIKKVLVQNGESVERGTPLVLFDDTEESLANVALRNSLAHQLIEAEKARLLLIQMSGGRGTLCKSFPLGASERVRCETGAQAEWEEMHAKNKQLMAQIAQRYSELQTVDEQIAKYEELLPIIAKRHQDFEDMKIQGFVSKYSVQDRFKDRVEMERELKTLQARRAEATSAVDSAKAGRESWIFETKRGLTERVANADAEVIALRLKLETSQFSLSQKILRAPTSGRVQEISLKNEGEVATAAQSLMVLVPETRTLNITAALSSSDIGFVNAGQAVVIKLDTFPYTKYGYLHGRVTTISSDSVADGKNGEHFVAQIRPDHDYIAIEGKKVPLSPGMTLSAEIVTDERRVIDFIFDPIIRRVTSSMHER